MHTLTEFKTFTHVLPQPCMDEGVLSDTPILLSPLSAVVIEKSFRYASLAILLWRYRDLRHNVHALTEFMTFTHVLPRSSMDLRETPLTPLPLSAVVIEKSFRHASLEILQQQRRDLWHNAHALTEFMTFCHVSPRL